MKLWRKNAVKQALESKLAMDFGDGKELNAWFIHEGVKITRVTIPKGRGELVTKTQESIRKKLRLSQADFQDLLSCPLRLEGFIEIISSKGLLKQ